MRLECEGTPLSTATGFVVQRAGVCYLITNWHVLTGLDPITRFLLDPHGRRPDSVRIAHTSASWNAGRPTFVEKVEPLYAADDSRLWCEHPDHGESVDVVALPLTRLDDVKLSTYDPWRPPYVRFGVGDEVSIVGFPFGISSDGLALWTRGSIASEFEEDHDGTPRFLIDARTRPGQSGSPVIFFRTGAYFEKYGGIVLPNTSHEFVPTPGKPIAPDLARPLTGFTEEFLGVYSGRIHADSDLGSVWRPSALRDILEAAAAKSNAHGEQ